MNKTLLLAVAALALAASSSSFAQSKVSKMKDLGPPVPVAPKAPTPPPPLVLPACAVTDISLSAVACQGFFEGNLLNTPHIAEQTAALAALGFAWDGVTFIEEDVSTDGDPVGLPAFQGQIDFANGLVGTAYFGIHFGQGVGSPGRDARTDTTAFYKISNIAGLDKINLVYNSGSTARLYAVAPPIRIPPISIPVPEPATWAMMIAGFGGVGAMLRRRRATLAA